MIDSENQLYCVQCGFWMVHPDDFDEQQHIQVQQKWKPAGGQLVNDFTPLSSSTPELASIDGVARGSGLDLSIERKRSSMGFNSSGRHGVDEILNAEAKEMGRLHQSKRALSDPAVLQMINQTAAGRDTQTDPPCAGSSPAETGVCLDSTLNDLQQKLDDATQQLQQPCSMQEQTTLMGFIKETALALKALRDLQVK